MKRFFAFLLILACLLPYAACKKEVPSDGTGLRVIADGCMIYYDPDTAAEADVKALASAIKKATGLQVTFATDTFIHNSLPTEGIIYVGKVNRAEATEAYGTLRKRDYICGIYDDRYLIGGLDADASARAIDYFIEALLPAAEGKTVLTVTAEQNYRYEAKYGITSFTVNGRPIYEFTIVTSKNATASEQRIAYLLRERILVLTGYTLTISNGKKVTTPGELRVGGAAGSDVAARHGYTVAMQGDVMTLTAQSPFGYAALETVISKQLFVAVDGVVALTENTLYSGRADASETAGLTHSGEIRIMFHNVWGSADHDVAQRAGMLAEIYAEYLPDVIGLQEFSPAVRQYMEPLLTALGYAEVPVRVAGNQFYGGEKETRTPVFYRTETVELLSSDYNCLAVMDYSKYPELMGGYSAADLSDAASGDRSKAVTWGIFRVKSTGNIFLAGSTHLWWQAKPIDDVARIIQMREMRELLTKSAADYAAKNGITGTIPAYVGGDFNARMNRESYHSMGDEIPFENINFRLPEGSRLSDSSMQNYPDYDEQSGLWRPNGTPEGAYSNSLDHIFCDASAGDTYVVNAMGMPRELYARMSDHAPIFADITFTDAVAALDAQ